MKRAVARRFLTAGAAVLLAVLAIATRLEAQTGLPPQPFEAARSNGAFTGTLVSTDATHLVVQADDGSVVTFVVDSTSSIPPGLVPGSRISVRYEAAEGNRHRVASVGIPKIPLEPGTTTEPPPTTAEEPEPTPPVEAGASLRPREAAAEGPFDASAIPAVGESAGSATQPESTRKPAGPESSPSSQARAGEAGAHAAPRADAPGPELNAGRDAVVIGAGLVVVALALGALLLLRR